MGRSKFDQFYTKPEVAKNCIDKLDLKDKIIIEPSAGCGSFSNQIENCLAYDIDPQADGIIKLDFFNLKLNTDKDKTIIIGNPPFGKNASLAVKFFNHSCNFANTIAFILPNTFRKTSIHNRLNLNYWLTNDIDLDKNSFIFNNEEYNAPCCFQIWEFRGDKRVIEEKISTELFEFIDKDDCDENCFAIRRVGGKAGKCIENYKDCLKPSNYFIRPNIDKKELMQIVNSINFEKVANATAGMKSLSKQELLKYLNAYIQKRTKCI
jgi:hypothetical protein